VHTKQGQILLKAITYEIMPTENFVPVNGKVKGQLLSFHFNPALFADLAPSVVVRFAYITREKLIP
jgi:hypothetical protein